MCAYVVRGSLSTLSASYSDVLAGSEVVSGFPQTVVAVLLPSWCLEAIETNSGSSQNPHKLSLPPL